MKNYVQKYFGSLQQLYDLKLYFLTVLFFAPPVDKKSFDRPELLSIVVIRAEAPKNLFKRALASASSTVSPSSITAK